MPGVDHFSDKSPHKNYIKTKTIQNNGFNPTWDTYAEFDVNFPELALLEVLIMDDNSGKDGFIGMGYKL